MAAITTARRGTGVLPIELVNSLLDTVERSILVAERSGGIVVANLRARQWLESQELAEANRINLFTDVLQIKPKVIYTQLESGEHEVSLEVPLHAGKTQARVRWMPEPDWLVVQFVTNDDKLLVDDGEGRDVQQTVRDLLQEREITYRNLLAAYLRLQEVNRQKTVFLASAAHELKTPLAVIKGYYDLLLTGSPGKLSEKQKDILEESKESCERLVRLVSMFLNYSALESGKLVLHLRENDLRDCLDELALRWLETFQRKGVRLEKRFEPGLPVFRFDYQKLQQVVANLLDNALKHTPEGGCVTLRVAPHFWERRVAEATPVQERRRARTPKHNSVEISVSDTGPGIAPEYHQEIFEDFVRIDPNTAGMGLGLAIAKRLVQAHRGKIWVDSMPERGSTFTFLMPIDQH
ncbi:MAG: HAMP domain-containing sensor histidine kinase [Candidatus Acidiferrales bacterium]